MCHWQGDTRLSVIAKPDNKGVIFKGTFYLHESSSKKRHSIFTLAQSYTSSPLCILLKTISLTINQTNMGKCLTNCDKVFIQPVRKILIHDSEFMYTKYIEYSVKESLY